MTTLNEMYDELRQAQATDPANRLGFDDWVKVRANNQSDPIGQLARDYLDTRMQDLADDEEGQRVADEYSACAEPHIVQTDAF